MKCIAYGKIVKICNDRCNSTPICPNALLDMMNFELCLNVDLLLPQNGIVFTGSQILGSQKCCHSQFTDKGLKYSSYASL